MTGIPDFTKNNSGKSRKLPITTNRNGLVGEFLFGRNIATSRVNSAGAKANAAEALIGGPPAPVYGDHQVTLGNGAGLDSGLIATAAQTVFLVTSVAAVDAIPDGTANALYSALPHGASAAQSGRFNLSTAVLGTTGRKIAIASSVADAGGATSFEATGPYTTPRLLVSRITGIASGSTVTVDEYVNGTRTNRATATTTADRAAPTYGLIFGNSNTIGAGGAFQSRLNIVAALVYNRAVSDAEELAIYLELRAVLATMGKAI